MNRLCLLFRTTLCLLATLPGCKKEDSSPPARHAPYGNAPRGPHATYPRQPGGPSPNAAQPPAPLEQARARCVQLTNQYRASVGVAPVRRRTDREPCTDRQAASDASRGQPHGAFGQCGELAQNECPRWPGPPDRTIDLCLQRMFDEGPGTGDAHGHYNNLISARYTGVACGFDVQPDGTVWILQSFYP